MKTMSTFPNKLFLERIEYGNMLLTEIIETKNYNFCKNVELESLSLTELEVLCALGNFRFLCSFPFLFVIPTQKMMTNYLRSPFKTLAVVINHLPTIYSLF